MFHFKHALTKIHKFNPRPSFLSSIQLSMSTTAPIEQAITEALTKKLEPIHLEVVNESESHNVPKGAETHFRVLVVSEKFESLPLIKRHRLVNDIVKEALNDDFVHALAIETKSPAQWNEKQRMGTSPKCTGGFGK